MKFPPIAPTVLAALVGGISLTTVAVAEPVESCDPVAGIDEVLAHPSLRYLIIGDYHGTSEIPRFFADVVCNAMKSGRRVSVGLEWPYEAEPALAEFMSAPNDEARNRLLSALVNASRDGRASDAMLALVDQLRAYDEAGMNVSVVLFQPEPGLEGTEYEQRLAQRLVDGARRQTADLTIALVGNVHALRQSPPTTPDLRPMATFLPEEQTLTFNVVGYYGAAWSCRATAGDGADPCRAWPLRDGDPGPKSITMTNEGRFNGRYSVGAPFSASPPAVLVDRPAAFPDSRLRSEDLPLKRTDSASRDDLAHDSVRRP